MSGLAAIIHNDGRPADPALIRRMTVAMEHRGPDGISHWCEGPAAIGLCLMATTTGMAGATVARQDDRIAVMSGYLADRQRLASELGPERNHLRTDPDLLLAAFRKWQRDCARPLRGAFAALIWDREAKSLVGFRDHLGQKPLHYHWDGRTLSIASDLAALLALPWIEPGPNLEFAAELVTASVFNQAETLWSGIQRLPPGHSMTLAGDRLRIRPYWSPLDAPDVRYRSDADYAGHYQDLLTHVTRRHAESDRPIGCEVSGGLDSSAVFALAQKLKDDAALPAPALHGFTLDFGDNPAANDLPFARSVARHLGTEVAEIQPFQPDLDWFAGLGRRFHDLPGYPNGAMGLGILQAARDQGCRVILNGTGGDEWLSGSGAVYTDAAASLALGTLASCLRTEIAETGLRPAVRSLLRYGIFEHLPVGARSVIARFLGRRQAPSDEWIAPALAAGLARRRAKWRAQLEGCQSAAKTDLEAQRLDGFRPLAIELGERLAALHGIEQRAPMLDPDFVEFAYAVPPRLHWAGGPIKALHRVAMGDLLPEDVRDRRDKADFSLVFDSALANIPSQRREEVSDRMAALLSAEARSRLAGHVPFVGSSGPPLWQFWSVYAVDLVFN